MTASTAPRATLQVSNKLLSMSGTMQVTDESGRHRFEVRGRSWFWPRYTVARDGREVAQLRRKLLALMPKWLVGGELGAFTVRRQVAFGGRRYVAEGGRFDGARIRGSLLDLSFEVEHRGALLATARGRLLSLTDVHRVDLHSDDPQAVLFALLAIAIVQADRRVEAASADD